MRILPQLFKKDLGRFKFLLIVYFLILLLQIGVQMIGTNAIGGDLNKISEFEQISATVTSEVKAAAHYILMTFNFLIVLFSIPLVIQEDNLVGTKAFWLTRPITNKSLLVTKMFFIFLFFVILPCIIEVFVLMGIGFSVGQSLAVIPHFIIYQCSTLVFIIFLAGITRSMAQYIVGLIVTFMGLLLLVPVVIGTGAAVTQTLLEGELFSYYVTQASNMKYWQITTIHLLSVIFTAWIVYDLFLTRRRARAIVWMIFIIVFLTGTMFIIMPIMAYKFHKEPQPSVELAKNIGFSFKKPWFELRDAHRGSGMVKIKDVVMREAIVGVPEHQFAFVTIRDPEVNFADGTKLTSEVMALTQHRDRSINQKKYMASLKSALGDANLLNPLTNDYFYASLISLPENAFDYYKYRTGVYTAVGSYDVYEYRIGGRTDLKGGNNIRYPFKILKILSVLEKPDGIEVVLEERHLNYMLHNTKKISKDNSLTEYSYGTGYEQTFVLINKKSKQAFIVEPELKFNTEMSGGTFDTRVGILVFNHVNQRTQNQFLPKLDAEWLKNAELVHVYAQKVAQVEKPMEYKFFDLPNYKKY